MWQLGDGREHVKATAWVAACGVRLGGAWPGRAGQGREGPARAEDEVHIAKRARQGPEPQVR